VRLALFNELYLTLQTGFAVRWCFLFSANNSSVEEVCPLLPHTVISRDWRKSVVTGELTL